MQKSSYVFLQAGSEKSAEVKVVIPLRWFSVYDMQMDSSHPGVVVVSIPNSASLFLQTNQVFLQVSADRNASQNAFRSFMLSPKSGKVFILIADVGNNQSLWFISNDL